MGGSAGTLRLMWLVTGGTWMSPSVPALVQSVSRWDSYIKISKVLSWQVPCHFHREAALGCASVSASLSSASNQHTTSGPRVSPALSGALDFIRF